MNATTTEKQFKRDIAIACVEAQDLCDIYNYYVNLERKEIRLFEKDNQELKQDGNFIPVDWCLGDDQNQDYTFNLDSIDWDSQAELNQILESFLVEVQKEEIEEIYDKYGSFEEWTREYESDAIAHYFYTEGSKYHQLLQERYQQEKELAIDWCEENIDLQTAKEIAEEQEQY